MCPVAVLQKTLHASTLTAMEPVPETDSQTVPCIPLIICRISTIDYAVRSTSCRILSATTANSRQRPPRSRRLDGCIECRQVDLLRHMEHRGGVMQCMALTTSACRPHNKVSMNTIYSNTLPFIFYFIPGAAIDVYPVSSNPTNASLRCSLLGPDRVILTPHADGSSRSTMFAMREDGIELERFNAGLWTR